MTKYLIMDRPLRDDELMHWKYVSKKKVNGKWRYYYNIGYDSTLDGSGKPRGHTVKGYSKLHDMLGYDERDRANIANAEYQRADKASRNREYNSLAEMNATHNRVAKLGQRAIESNKAFQKTPLGVLDTLSSKVKKVKRSIGTWLTKLGKKLYG